MEQDALYSGLLAAFQQTFGSRITSLTDALSAKDVKGWDSFSHLNLITAIEMKFHTQFSDQELQSMHCVGDIARLLRERLATPSEGAP